MLSCHPLLLLMSAVLGTAWGHGRLIEPPSRASAWRYGFQTPPNYNDHELYCGGFSRQWSRNGGKCGECGDAWDMQKPRPHELGGRWGKGIIVRQYQVNAIILMRVELTASHSGFFEFRLCPESPATQECFDKHLLPLIGVPEPVTKFYPKSGSKVYEIRAELPRDMSCSRCVLQWRYVAGNNWGTCDDGTGAVGCGRQEEFRACSDISIGDAVTSGVTTMRPSRPGATTTTETSSSESPPLEKLPEEDNYLVGFIISFVMLMVALCSLALLYLYFYRGGQRIKNLLKRKPKANIPVPPPRLKKAAREINDNEPNITRKEQEALSNTSTPSSNLV